MTPVWLKTLFLKWQAARGDRLPEAKLAFGYEWEKLLDEADLRLVDDRKHAAKELERLEKSLHLKSKPHRFRRYLIEKVFIPVESEAWLMSLFDHEPAKQRHDKSLAILAEFKLKLHPLYPDLWTQWCDKIQATFHEGKTLPPISWKSPEEVRELLTLTYSFSSQAWSQGTAIRDASKLIGLDSKGLEENQKRLESCLSSLLDRETTLESCGLTLTTPKADVAGKITLHFEDGTSQAVHEMKGVYSLSILDLERAACVETTATRILTVENAKTTHPALAVRNTHHETLLIACSFPNRAVIRLLELLPSHLPLYHFGDTDPAGFLILSTLRQKVSRPIQPFLMKHRAATSLVPLTEYDRKIIPTLLASPTMQDVLSEIQAMVQTQSKGDFEQEGIGIPDLDNWPFYSAHALA